MPDRISPHSVFSKLPWDEQLGCWVHSHSTTMKTMKVAFLVLGTLFLTAGFCCKSGFGRSFSTSLKITGVLLILASTNTIDHIFPYHHNMRKHVFQEGRCEAGRLFYDGDVPVLSINTDDPYKAGTAQGCLCGEAIGRLFKRFYPILHTYRRQLSPNQLGNMFMIVRASIPQKYFLEMAGVVDGYNEWLQTQGWWRFYKKITVEDLLLFNLLPDSSHFNLQSLVQSLISAYWTKITSAEMSVACSSIVEKDAQRGMVVARNMDWPTFGLAGRYSLVFNRISSCAHYNTVEVGIPGLIGTITGMNSCGLSLAMNTCFGDSIVTAGMPALFYNRACLEQCQNVGEVEAFVANEEPLGAYHLTIADEKKAESIHFFQSPAGTHVIRALEEGKPLVTLNFRYEPEPTVDDGELSSCRRQQAIDGFLLNREERGLEAALSLPMVNNRRSAHSVVMEPGKKKFIVAMDDAYAGKAFRQEIQTENLLAGK